MIMFSKDQSDKLTKLAPTMFRLLLLLQQEWMKNKIKLSPSLGIEITKIVEQVK
jgi:hypothetical protein